MKSDANMLYYGFQYLNGRKPILFRFIWNDMFHERSTQLKDFPCS